MPWMIDSIFQGTVLDRCLWNCYYENAKFAIKSHGFLERVLADDFMVFKAVDAHMPDELVLSCLEDCQAELYAWGSVNQVVCNCGQESCHLLHHRHPCVGNVK